MNAWLHSLAGRLVLALLAAALGITALQFGVVRGEAAAARRSDVVAPPAARRPLGIGIFLPPAAGTILLAFRAAAVAPDVAPVVQVFADGSVALRRPSRLAQGPASAAAPSRDGFGAAILLPAGSLSELTPSARGAVIEILGQFVAERPVAERRLAAIDFRMAAFELATLLRWVP